MVQMMSANSMADFQVCAWLHELNLIYLFEDCKAIQIIATCNAGYTAFQSMQSFDKEKLIGMISRKWYRWVYYAWNVV